MRTVTIDWPVSHDAADGEDAIMGSLEAGYDEGPLIVLPWGPGGPGRGRPGSGPLVFADASDYLAHLAMHGDEVSGERSVGLVRGSARENGEAALAALAALRDKVPAAGRRPRPSGRVAQPPAADYASYAGTPALADEVRVEHIGEGLDDVRRRFPSLVGALPPTP